MAATIGGVPRAAPMPVSPLSVSTNQAPPQVRTRLAPGGRRIRTRGPALRRPPPRRATGFRAVRPARAEPLGGPKLESASFSGEAFSCLVYASDHQFVGDAAYINLEIEALYRRTREMPGQTSRDGSTADELVGKERMDVEDRINLGRGHIRPAEPERRHAQLHRPEHEARLLAHRLRRLIAAPNDASFIGEATLARFAASGGDKAARRAVFPWHGVAEGVERRCSGRVDFRADIRAGNRVDLVAEDPPGGQPLNIMPIERDEAGVGELRLGITGSAAKRAGRVPTSPRLVFKQLGQTRISGGTAEALPQVGR